MKRNLRIQSAVICDDIRHETTGKTILIGAYAGDLVFKAAGKAPYQIVKALWVQAEYISESEVIAELLVTYNGKKVMQARQPLPGGNKGKIIAIPAHRVSFGVSAPGSLEVKFREEGQSRWKVILRQPVRYRDSDPPTA